MIKKICAILIVSALSSCSAQALSTENKKLARDDAYQTSVNLNLSIAQSFKDKNCEEALHLLNRDNNEKRFYNRTKAIMMAEGLCLEKDLQQAITIFEERLINFPHDDVILARLGSLYWNGNDVPKDEEKAKKLFSRAIVAMGANLIGMSEQNITVYDKKLAEVWDTTPEGMLLGFIDEDTGPWELPPPLEEHIKWLEGKFVGNGQEIVNVAFHLQNGTSGLEKDEPMAFKWLFRAAVVREIPSAFFPLAKWLWDTNTCQEESFSLSNCKAAYSLAETMFLKAAEYGNTDATKIIGNCVLASEEFPRQKYAVYYWLLRMKREGLEVKEEELQKARDNVPVNERWIVEEWHLDAERGLPFTRLNRDKC